MHETKHSTQTMAVILTKVKTECNTAEQL